MKRIILFSTILLGMGSLLIAQTGIEQECVNCKENEISRTSSAVGVLNVATGETSFASGYLNTSTGDYSTTLGFNNSAQGNYSIAGGEECIATGLRAFAFGQYARADGSRSLALGKYVRATAGNSVAIGRYVKSNISDAMILGCGLDTNRYITNSINGSFMIGYNSNVHTFFVGSAYGENTTGRIGIGNVIEPDAKLHIRGDDLFWNTDDASLFIESAGNRYSYIYLGDQDHYIKTKPNYNLEFYAEDQDFFFNGGKVGIGTTDFGNNKLAVAGNIKAEGLEATGNIGATNIVASGFMEATEIEVENLKLTNGAGSNKILLSDNEGSASWVPQSSLDDGDWSTAETGDLYFNAGKVGIGTTEPDYSLDVNGIINFTSELLHNGQPFETSKWETSGDDIFYDQGNVGIGTPDTEACLQVSNNSNYLLGRFNRGNRTFSVGPALSNGSLSLWGSTYIGFNLSHEAENVWNVGMPETESNGGAMIFGTVGGDLLFTTVPKSDTGIQQLDDDQIKNSFTRMRLTSNGVLETIEVTVEASIWSDYVFNDDYTLPGLNEVEKYIAENKHLPDIPSEADVKEEGINLGEMDALLLKKIEELTLYTC